MIQGWKSLAMTLLFTALASMYASSAPARTAAAPMRIVSLAPNLTEILFDLGLADRIVGVTNVCDYPSEAKTKPVMGGMSNPSLERVIEARPDLVVVTIDGNRKEFEQRLRSLGIRTYVFKALRIEDFPEAIRELGMAVGDKVRAEKLASGISRVLSDMKTMKRPRARRALYIVWPEPLMVAAPGSIADDALTLLGQINVANNVVTAYPKYSLEEVLRQDPEIIFIGSGYGMKESAGRLLKRLQGVAAVREDRVFPVSDNLYRLGPRIIKGIAELREILEKEVNR